MRCNSSKVPVIYQGYIIPFLLLSLTIFGKTFGDSAVGEVTRYQVVPKVYLGLVSFGSYGGYGSSSHRSTGHYNWRYCAIECIYFKGDGPWGVGFKLFDNFYYFGPAELNLSHRLYGHARSFGLLSLHASLYPTYGGFIYSTALEYSHIIYYPLPIEFRCIAAHAAVENNEGYMAACGIQLGIGRWFMAKQALSKNHDCGESTGSLLPKAYLGLVKSGIYHGYHYDGKMAPDEGRMSLTGLRIGLIEADFFTGKSRWGLGFTLIDLVGASHGTPNYSMIVLSPRLSYVIHSSEYSFGLLSLRFSPFTIGSVIEYDYEIAPPFPLGLSVRFGGNRSVDGDAWNFQAAAGVHIGLGYWWTVNIDKPEGNRKE